MKDYGRIEEAAQCVKKEKEEEVEDDHITLIIVRYALISYQSKLHTEELHSTFCSSTQLR